MSDKKKNQDLGILLTSSLTIEQSFQVMFQLHLTLIPIKITLFGYFIYNSMDEIMSQKEAKSLIFMQSTQELTGAIIKYLQNSNYFTLTSSEQRHQKMLLQSNKISILFSSFTPWLIMIQLKSLNHSIFSHVKWR